MKVGGGGNLCTENSNGNDGNDLLEEEFMVHSLLLYIYTGILDFNGQEIIDILDLLVAADELILDELIEH
ncbi:19157_t:CDS:2, partial [Entrophospora sp. SA101]